MVHLCTIVPISKSVGANRIYPGVAIPYPTGDPALSEAEEKKMRLEMLKEAVSMLAEPVESRGGAAETELAE